MDRKHAGRHSQIFLFLRLLNCSCKSRTGPILNKLFLCPSKSTTLKNSTHLQFFSVTLVHFSNGPQYLQRSMCISQNNSHKLHHTMDFLQKPVTYSKVSIYINEHISAIRMKSPCVIVHKQVIKMLCQVINATVHSVSIT